MNTLRIQADSFWYKNRIFIISIGLFASAWLLYGNTLRNGYNIDDRLVTQNHPLTSQGIAAIPKIFTSPYYFDEAGYAFDYRPVVSSSFAIEHSLFGETPLISHGINVFLYGLTGILLFFLLRLLFPRQDKRRRWFSAVVSVLFLIHPLHTEVVNSIKSRDELLAFLFSLLATYLFVFGKAKKHPIAWYALGTGLFALGLMSKLSALSFAVVIPLSLVLFRRVDWKETLLISIPLTTVSLVLLPPLGNNQLLLISISFTSLPLLVLFAQRISLLHDGAAMERSPIPFSILSLLGLVFLLVGTLWWISAPYSSFAPLLFWVSIGVSLFAFSGNKAIHWVLISVHVLLLLMGLYTKSHPLLIIGGMYGLFYLFSSPNDRPRQIWCAYGGWLLLAIAALIYIGAPASTVVFLMVSSLLWLGRLSRIKYALLLAIGLSVVLTVYLATIQEYHTMALFLLSTLFLAVQGLSRFRKKAFEIATVGITIIGFSAIFVRQPAFTGSTEEQLTNQAVQLPFPAADDDRDGRVLEFSENPIDYEAREKRLPTALNITKQYLQLMVWPVPLRFYYGYNMIPVLNWSAPKVWVALFLLLGLSLLILSAIFWDAWIAWGGILLLISLAQFSNYLIPLPGIMGERFLYIGSLGFIILVVQLLRLALQKWNLARSTNTRRLGILLGLALLVSSSVYIVQRNQQWKDTMTLYQHDIKHLSQSAKAHQLLASKLLQEAEKYGQATQRQKLLEEAATHFKACLEIYPFFLYAYFDLGTTLMKLGQYDQAQQATERSMKVDLSNPQARFQLALIHELQEDWPKAIEAYQATIANAPNSLEAYLNLSTLHFRIGNFEEGLQVSYSALERWPESSKLLINIGNALASNNAYTEAAIYFTRALKQQQGDRSLIEKIVYCYQQADRPDLTEFYLKMLQ